MPIALPDGLRRLTDQEFKEAAYVVMEAVFSVHNELGRLFNEEIYRAEVAHELQVARTQVLFEAWFDTFRKPYYVDLLFRDGAVFEFKTAAGLVERHRAQLLNYLLCLDLPHGKLINFRTESVEHEFVNAPLTRAERTSFSVSTAGYRETGSDSKSFVDLAVALLRDWGTCLEVGLYEEALTHFCGGEQDVVKPVDVTVNSKTIGSQTFRLLSPRAAFKVTGFEGDAPTYESALRNLLKHVGLDHLQWVNVAKRKVSFKTLSK